MACLAFFNTLSYYNFVMVLLKHQYHLKRALALQSWPSPLVTPYLTISQFSVSALAVNQQAVLLRSRLRHAGLEHSLSAHHVQQVNCQKRAGGSGREEEGERSRAARGWIVWNMMPRHRVEQSSQSRAALSRFTFTATPTVQKKGF